MDKFIGKFKCIPEKTEGMEEHFKAMKLGDEALEFMSKAMVNLVTELSKMGEDSYKESNDYDGKHKEEFVFKLGEPCVTNIMNMDTKNTFTLNAAGDCVDGVTELKGTISRSKRYWKGDLLYFESEGNGSTMTTVFKKI